MKPYREKMVVQFFVAPSGNDENPGTREFPFATLERAQRAVRDVDKRDLEAVEVLLRAGNYYAAKPIRFFPEDSGTDCCTILYRSYPGENVTLSGGKRINARWEPFTSEIWRTKVPEDILPFGQLFVNGERQILARYPNQDDSDPGKSGYVQAAGRLPDDLRQAVAHETERMSYSGEPPRGILYAPETFRPKPWSHPEKAIVHVFQAMYWGNLQFSLQSRDDLHHALWFGEGGTQIGAKWHNDPCRVDEHSRFFVENVLEELDAPGEWYFDEEERWLYLIPPETINLKTASIEVSQLEHLIEFCGSQRKPVQHIEIRGFRFAHTEKTFMEEYDVPSLGDWAIHRGGTVLMQGTQDCAICENHFDAVGGNGVFLNGYNYRAKIHANHFEKAGDSAVCLVGIQNMVVGSQRYFPCECEVTHNIVHDCGVFGKQVAGFFVSVAKRITVGHNLIFKMPRAGICINDGTWGGHTIEFNYIFDTCRETADHGPFNAWGRDRYWCLLHSHGPTGEKAVCHQAGDVFVDQMETVIVRNNFFQEKSGWGLDLDDGASNYHIYNNLCVGVSMKLREGAYRLIENNIWVNGANSPCFHVGNLNNHDRYVRNITVMSAKNSKPEHDLDFEMGAHHGEFYTLIKPPFQGPWLEEIDYNLFFNDLGEFSARAITGEAGTGQKMKFNFHDWQKRGFDQHSIYADPCFADPANNDYTVLPHSPALKLGFQNFSMHFGPDQNYLDQWNINIETIKGESK